MLPASAHRQLTPVLPTSTGSLLAEGTSKTPPDKEACTSRPRWSFLLSGAVTATACTVVCCWAMAAGVRKAVGCWQPDCNDWIADMSTAMDLTKDPCDDFYGYVCGNKRGMQAFHGLSMSIRLSFFKRLLVLDHRDAASTPSRAHRQVAHLVQRCFQQALNGPDHMDFVRDVMAQHGLSWPPEKRPHRSVLDSLVELSLARGLHPLLRLEPGPLLKRPGFYALHLDIALVSMNEWNSLRSRLVSEGALGDFFAEMALLLSPQEPDPQLIERVTALDNMVATAVLPALGQDAEGFFNYVRVASLQEFVGEFFDSRDFLSAVNRVLQPGQKLSDQDELVVTRSVQLRPLGRLLLAHQESQTVRGYTAMMLARYLAPFSSAALTRSLFSDQGRHIWAVTLAASHCVALAVEELSYATGDMLSRWYFAPDKMATVREIASRVFNATKKGWLGLGWIDSATQALGLEHIRSLELLLGRPSNLSTVAQLDAYYSYFPALHGSFPEMWSSMKRSQAKAVLKLIGASRPFFAPVSFRLPMVTVDAFYLPVYHAVVIPPAIMFAPFFDQRAPAPINYGGLGHIIAHEVTHGIDLKFSVFSSRGDWWSKESRASFQSRLDCLRELYNDASVAVTGIHFGDSAKGENFADAGGMRKALDAFKALTPEGAQRLGERSYSPEKLFFISSCHKWCTAEHRSRESVLSEDVRKKYSPPQMRCNVPLMNTKEFAQAFGCEDGSYMNAKKRCDVF